MAVAFGALLRGGGLGVPLGSVLAFTQALGAVGVERRGAVYWAGRATLVRRPEDRPVYDRAFSAFWRGTATIDAPAPAPVGVTLAIDADGDPPADAGLVSAGSTLTVRYSAAEVLRRKDFA